MGISYGRLHPIDGGAVRRFTLSTVVLTVFLLSVFASLGVDEAAAQVAGDTRYAVLYNGNSGYYVYMNDLKFAFKTLINDFGYTKQNIVVVSYSGYSYDLDGDGLNDIDFSATAANVDTVFTRLKRVMTDQDVFFFFATDHGTKSNSDCNDAGLSLYNGGTLWEETLAAYIDSLDSSSRQITKILLFNTCYAGGMIPELNDLDYPLMISTASKECEASHYHYSPADTFVSSDHAAYSFWWMGAMHGSSPDGSHAMNADYNNNGCVSVQEAARYAKENDEFAQKNASPKEHPLYWDTDCIVGQRTTLNGTCPGLPGMFVFRYNCHDPLPYRWRSWSGMGGPWPSPPGGTPIGAGPATRTLWTVPGQGETIDVYAIVYNPGDVPITEAEVVFYYSDPTLSLIYPQPGLHTIGMRTVPLLLPGMTETVGPVSFTPPPANSFGEPHWALFAIAQHMFNPVESGWLTDDDHVAASNRIELTGSSGEYKTFHVVARNALDTPVKALLSVDESNYPTSWSVTLNPPEGDTLTISPNSWTPVEVVLRGFGGGGVEGVVEIMMSLYTTSTKECESCDDSTCGGYIGDAGGCSVKLVVEGPVGAEPTALRLDLLQNYPNPFNPATTISFTLPEKTQVVLAIYDIHGQQVAKLVDEVLDRGENRSSWDGKDANGNRVGSGVYFCRLDAGGQTLTRKIVLLK